LVNYLAAGIDPEKSVIYVQSDVRETFELYLFLNMHAYMGELAKTTSFKEKARKQPENVNAGLLTYPTLMAADILVHNADKVPVGKDQEQHLEMTRRFARRFNNFYGVEFFKEPVAYNFGQELYQNTRIDGSGKWGKSEGNAVTVDTLIEKGFDPLAYRYMTLTAHYRTKLTFTLDDLAGAQTALQKLKETMLELKKKAGSILADNGKTAEYRKMFAQAVNDDLNMPKALALVWIILKDAAVAESDKYH